MSLKTPSQVRAERMRVVRRFIRTGSYATPSHSPLEELTVDQLVERLSSARNKREVRQITRELAYRILR